MTIPFQTVTQDKTFETGPEDPLDGDGGPTPNTPAELGDQVATSWDVDEWFDQSVYDLIASWYGEEAAEEPVAPLENMNPDDPKNPQDRPILELHRNRFKAFPRNSLFII